MSPRPRLPSGTPQRRAATTPRTPREPLIRLLSAAPLRITGAFVLAFALACAAPGCGGAPPLALTPKPLRLTHDGFFVHDAAVIDPDRDGDMDVVALTQEQIYYMEHIEGGWLAATAGTGLAGLPTGQRLHPVMAEGLDFLIERDGVVSRLVYSGIGSWTEAEEPGYGGGPEVSMTVAADFNGDGQDDAATAEGRRVRIVLTQPDGPPFEATSLVGADGLMLPAAARRLIATDLEGDGDTDLLVVGGRIFVLINNGGVSPTATQ